MRLWHQALIPFLDNRRLLGQHRECCALRGKGWGKKHSVVDYVFKYDLAHLYEYHCKVMDEMIDRDYSVDAQWYNRLYRGKNLQFLTMNLFEVGTYVCISNEIIYPEHNDRYLLECLLNLKSKGANLVNGESLEHMLLLLALKGIK